MQAHDDPRADENLAGGAIDLGEVRRDGGAGEDDASPPWHPRAWLRKGSKALAVGLLTLLAPHASTVPVPTGLGEPLWSAIVQWDGMAVGAGVVYLPEGSGGTTIVARDAWTGQEVWRRELDRRPSYVIEVAAGVAAIQTPSGITLVSARTGQVLHQVPGSDSVYVQGVTPSGHLLLVGYVEPCPLDEAFPNAGCTGVRALSISGDGEAWRLVTYLNELLVPSVADGRVTDLATIEPDGFTRFYDLRTGAVAATVTVEPNVASGVLTSDQIVVMAQDGDQGVVTAYDRGSLTRSWQTVLPAPAPTEAAGWFHTYQCEDFLCASTGSGTSLIDPDTGRIILDLKDQTVMSVTNGLFLSYGGSERSAANLDVTLWDAISGTVRAELPGSSPVTWTDSGGRALLARQGSEGTSFILVDGSGQTRVLGTVPQRVLSCEARGPLVLCRTLGRLQVWRLPVEESNG